MEEDSTHVESDRPDLPLEVDPDKSRLGDMDLLGILPIEASLVHNPLEELEEKHDYLQTEFSNIEEGVKIGFDEELWDILKESENLNPENINSEDDIPDELLQYISVEVGPYSKKDISEVVKDVQNFITEHDRSGIKITEKTPIDSDISFDLLSYFTFSAAVIEQRSASLLHESLISQEHRDNDTISQFIDERLSQHRREELLYDCNLIDGDLKNDLAQVRSYRNSLVHNPHSRQLIQKENAKKHISLALFAAKQLDENLRLLLQKNYEQ